MFWDLFTINTPYGLNGLLGRGFVYVRGLPSGEVLNVVDASMHCIMDKVSCFPFCG